MASAKKIKIGLLTGFALLAMAWAVSGTYSTISTGTMAGELDQGPPQAAASADDFVGSVTCKACHEDQFKSFAGTKHAKLAEVKSWKDKARLNAGQTLYGVGVFAHQLNQQGCLGIGSFGR